MDQKPKFSKVLAEFLFTPGFIIIVCIAVAAILVGIISSIENEFGEGSIYLVGAFICFVVIVVGVYLRLADKGVVPKIEKQESPEIAERTRVMAEVYKEEKKQREERIEREVSKAVAEYQKMRHEWAVQPDPKDIPDNMDENGYFYMTISEAKQIGQPPKRGGY